MDLIAEPWIKGLTSEGMLAISPLMIGCDDVRDLFIERPDFRGALYQFLIGLLQLAYAPEDLDEWRERWESPPDSAALESAFAPYRQAFLLENDGPAFMQDLQLPAEANHLPVLELLIDAGSGSNLYFNKPASDHGLCAACAAQALLTLQLNAPSGGRGVRTSLRGGGPLTTLLLPAGENSTLWQKLWLNVLPRDASFDKPVDRLSDVLPWMAPTRTSDDKGVGDTTPETVHPLQAYWSMPRRIRLDTTTRSPGDCSNCGATDAQQFRHYHTRHGGTNYTGNWTHPLTPYSLDPKGEKPPISIKGRQASQGYQHWLGLVLGNENHQPDAARVVAHHTQRVRKPLVRLWCFGYDMSNMKALCWYDSSLPVHALPAARQPLFVRSVKELLDVASETARALHGAVKAAWFRRPGDVGQEPAITQSFWQGSEAAFYRSLERLAALDFDQPYELAMVYRDWLLETRRLAHRLFDQWAVSAPIEDMDMERVVTAKADLGKQLNKATKALWTLVNQHDKEPA